MPRIARMVASGCPHHIVQRGNNKQRVFFDEQDRSLYLALLKKYSKECAAKVHAYCLMDNHVHALLTPELEDSLARTMQKLSLTYTQHINKKFNRTGRLWECRFHSSVVDKETYLWDKAQRQDYADFLNEPEDDAQVQAIRKCSCNGMPVGSERFMESISKVLKIHFNVRPRGRPRRNDK